MIKSDEKRKILDLSAVILTKNEEKLISECIESVISAIKYATEKKIIKTSEIILVDSASTDKTIDIAKKYPIKILQLDSLWPLSCGAGAHIGLLTAKGRNTCIVDGDIVLDKAWFVCSNPYIEREDVGGLQGIAKEYLKSNTRLHRNAIKYWNLEILEKHFTEKNCYNSDLYEEIKTATKKLSQGYSNATFYLKTEIARELGGYNPYLIAAEDTEMERQILDAGYKVLWIPCIMGTHYPAETNGRLTRLQNYKTLWRNSKGLGQAARYNFTNKKAFKKYMNYLLNKHFIKMNLIASVLILLLILNWILVLYHNFINALIIDFFIFTILIIRQAKKKQNMGLYLYNLLDSILFVMVRQFGFLRGFIKTPKDPKYYPKNPKIIKEPKSRV